MQNSYSPHEAQSQLMDLLRMLRGHWALLVATLVVGAFSAALICRILPPKYVATARIKGEGERPTAAVFELDREGDENYLQNQAEIIQSQRVLYPTIERLDLMKEWAKPGSSFKLSAAIRERIVYRIADSFNLRSEEDRARKPLSLKSAFWKLRSQMTVRRSGTSSLIEITITDTVANRVAQIANMVAVAFEEQQLERKREAMKKGLDQLRKEVDQQQERLKQAQEKVERLRKELNVPVFASANTRPDDVVVQNLLQELNRSRTDLVTQEAKLKELKKLDVTQLRTAASSISADSAVNKLTQDLASTELQIEVLKQGYGAEHPALKEAIASRDKLREQLDARLAGVLRGLEVDQTMAQARVVELEKRLAKATEAVGALDDAAYLPYRNAQRDEESERQLYEQIKSRLQRETVEMQVARSPVEIIDRAEPLSAAGTSLSFNLLVGSAGGLLLGVALAFILEFLNTSLKKIEDVEKHLGIPVLGVVPQNVGILGHGNGDIRHIEVYRMLRANIDFARGQEGSNSLCILSAAAGEGKSLTSSNLAVVWAQQGIRVVIVDCDLHRSSIHNYLHVPNTIGLVDYLSGDRTLDEVIAPTEFPNLCVVPSGAQQDDGASLPPVTSARIRELVKELGSRFDVVLYDTPPVLAVSDSVIIAREVGQHILVVQLHRYPRNMHQRAFKVLQGIGGQLLGAVVNKVRVGETDMDYYYQSDYATYRGAIEHRAPAVASGGRVSGKATS